MKSKLNKIAKAIQDHKTLSFYYDGYGRMVEPHALGLSSRGHYVLRCYQTGGSSREGKLGWKLMIVEDIKSLTAIPAQFLTPREGYKQGDKGMTKIISELKQG